MKNAHLIQAATAIFVFLVVLGALFLLPEAALAECCNPHSGGQCDDGSQTSTCCGKGACNIFCCNCSGGCRSGPCLANKYDPVFSPAGRFNSIDLDQSGGISLEEFGTWADQKGRLFGTKEDRQKVFENLDLNKNGMIDPGEFDQSLANAKPRATTKN